MSQEKRTNNMKVLSLFDGISCARVALERAGIPVEAYYASEIDKYAIQVSEKNYPDIRHIGDVKTLVTFPHSPECEIPLDRHYDFYGIDILIGGSPCQDLSIAKKDRKGLDGERSGLFWEYVRILREVKPKYFILENVASMSQEAKDTITSELGVEPIMINASLVSAQNRKRLFWTNIPNVTVPDDKKIMLTDVIETAKPEVYQYRRTYFRKNLSGKVPTLTANMGTGGNNVPYVISSRQEHATVSENKSTPLTSAMGMGGGHVPCITIDGENWRKITPVECERLQGLPDNYTEGISNTQRYKTLGNAFNVDVVAHILSFIPR